MRSVKLEIKLSIEVTEDGLITPKTTICVDSEPIGLMNSLKIRVDSDEMLPDIEIGMLRGHHMDLLSPDAKKSAEKCFGLLNRVPGVKCVMPAPRKT